ncbi:MAG TPA: ATPase [candidate division Zixibacteria bacterium]|nr:ATPase [candidate division Zixibacteria bacterium]
MNHYRHSIEEVAEDLLSDGKSGLSEKEAGARLESHGPNRLQESKRTGALELFASQFKNVMVIILLAAAVISALTHDVTDAIIIVLIAIINAVIGFIQEYKADRAMAALARMAQPLAKVVRQGRMLEVPSAELVPGDLLAVEAGARIPADARVVESASLKLEESALTGESLPVSKHAKAIREEVPVADRQNMLFMGTTCVYGRGQALVTATGMETELGKIARAIQSLGQGETPLQRRLAQVGKMLAAAAIILCAVIFVAGWARGIESKLMLLTAITLAVAAIPESLPAVITIVLSLGTQRMVKKKALIRKLPAVETLGSVTVICSDKTGTLTQNQMTVTDVHCRGRDFLVEGAGYAPAGGITVNGGKVDPDRDLKLLLLASCLCNDAVLSEEPGRPGDWNITGDPTEGALLTLAAKAGLWRRPMESEYPREAELPFDSERKMMSTVHRHPDGGFILFAKGAADNLLARCPGADREAAEQATARLASSGRRVLGFAMRRLDAVPKDPTPEESERELTFLGLAGMVDPARPEAKRAVGLCLQAGIRPMMITGDHPMTAAAIAGDLEISREGSRLVTGAQLKEMSDLQLAEGIDRISVFARVSPEDKIKIVQALQARGQVVAMTGDGVNDAPALKGADIGVAMGITGTDVSKEAADMILLDDNFATIVEAVAEGRRIYDNIRKFIRYMLSTNSGEVLTMFAAIMMGMPLPLIPIQILWINLVTDSLPALSLGLEPAERDIMRRQPRHPRESLFAHGLWQHIVWVGLLMMVGTLILFQHGLGLGRGETYARSMAFTCMAVFQLCHSLAIRSEQHSAFTIGFFSNPKLLGSVVLVLGLQMLLLYWPPFSGIFKLEALAPGDLALSLAVATSVFWAVELEKLLLKRFRRRRARP